MTVTVGSPPNANDDVASTPINTPVDIDVLVNDTDPDGDLDPDTLTIIDSPSNGTAMVNTLTNGIVYTPNTGFVGTDTLRYEVCDALGLCDDATVTVYVGGRPPGGPFPPVAVDDDAYTNQEQPVDIMILQNDYDSDGYLDVSTLIITSPVSYGNISILIVGDVVTVTYTPQPGYYGKYH